MGVPGRDSSSGLTELCERYPTLSIVILSGQPEAMLGALQLVFGGSLNVQAEPLTRDDESVAESSEKKLCHQPVSALTLQSRLDRAAARRACTYDAGQKQ